PNLRLRAYPVQALKIGRPGWNKTFSQEVTMGTFFLSEGKVDTSLGWLLWLLLAFFVFIVLVGWWVSRKEQRQAAEKGEEGHSGQGHVSAVMHGELKEAQAEDDLTILEGIGPKVAAILKEAGISTFAQLASSDAAHLKEILRQARLQMLDPRGWIEQAQLAAQGDWEGLKKLQAELKGGRRV
ncbi:MAG: DUF4332 domain-containing protein, partial [Anaerolineales bacterium]